MGYFEIKKLDEIIERLRGENGCPWDRQQTAAKMAVYLVEEAHELMQAVESGHTDEICEELGDVLFQVLFIAKLFQEKGQFDIEAAAARSREKMIRRHPHVFGDSDADTPEKIRTQWHQIKMQEKNNLEKKSVLDSVPASLPPLMRAYRISERAARMDFDWDDISGVMKQTESEWAEFQAEVAGNRDGSNLDKMAMEFGDLLFTLVNVARLGRIHPDTALNASTHKFERRFRHMEKVAAESGRKMDEIPRDEKEQMWEKAKQVCDE